MRPTIQRLLLPLLLLASALLLSTLAACGGGGTEGGGGGDDDDEGGGGTLPATSDYVVLAFNDLGMHCLNPTYDRDVFLPPYNTLVAQVVRRGNPPRLVTSGIRVSWRVVNNTTSYGKAGFGGFWDHMMDLFGTTLPPDTGLNLADPTVHNGLAGDMTLAGDRYVANGIPLTPLDDDLVWNPYQEAEITVRDLAGQLLVTTKATIPTSDEIHCAKCHQSPGSPSAPVTPYLELHDARHGTSLAASPTPFLCATAGCHVSPGLGQAPAAGVPFLSASIHGAHGRLAAASRPACYDCHPGVVTRCSRSLAHTADDGGCTGCHGDLAQVASSIGAGRIPWLDEPKCADCHAASIPQVDTGLLLYRDAVGHGGLGCPSCHQSPHAMVPSRVALDNAQAIQYQGRAVTIGSCGACHGSSRGGGDLSEFSEEHGGANPDRRTACHVCHTAVTTNTAAWPHGFQWRAR